MNATDSLLYPLATRTRRCVDLAGTWDFRFDPAGIGAADGWNEGLPDPVAMPVPSSFADLFTDKASREFTGDVWYATEMFVPGEWRGLDLSLRFGAATHRAVVFVNGRKAGAHEGGFTPFVVPIGDLVHFDAPNRIVVMVNNELREDCLPVGRTIARQDGTKAAKPYFDFFNYAGLQRTVHLLALPAKHIVDFTVAHALDGADAIVTYDVRTTCDLATGVRATGDLAVEVALLDGAWALARPGGERPVVASARGASGTLRVPDVRLWDVGAPNLYRVRIRLLDGERVVDEYEDDLGIRTVVVEGTKLLLNGRPIRLQGFGKHEDSDIVGRGTFLPALKRDFELLKWIGANSFRTAHYPHSEEVYRLADREGILVVDEVPAVGMMTSTLNFLDAARGAKTGFFEKPTTSALLTNHLAALEETLVRDRNHACVVAWSLLNEPETTDPHARPYLEAVFARARALDPQRRPCTYAGLMSAQPGRDTCVDLCDVVSLNRYYGWYVFGGFELADAEAALRTELDKWAELGLDRPFLFTEYGADTLETHKLPSVMWSEEYQAEFLEMTHRVFDAYDFVVGEQVWAFADFATGEGILRADGNRKGVFTRQRQPKTAAHWLRRRWTDQTKRTGGAAADNV